MHAFTRTFARATGITAAGAIALTAQAQNITIADLAPTDSLVVIGSNDMGAARTAFDRTGLKAMWDDPALREWATKAMGDAMEQARNDLDKMGVDLDELLIAPSGATGMAMWVNDEKPDQAASEFVIFADFEGNAEDLNESIVEIIMTAVEDKTYTLEETDFGNSTIYSLNKVPDGDDEKDNDEWQDEWGDGDDWQQGGMDDWQNAPMGAGESPIDTDELHYVRTGNHLIISSDMRQTQRALDLVETGADDQGAADNPNFQSAMTAIGHNHAYAYLSLATGDLMKELRAMPQAAMLGGVVETLGLDSLKAASMGLRFDTDAGMMESVFAIDVPEKDGLIALLDNPPMKLSPPAFVQANSTSFNAIQFDLANLFPTLEKAMNKLPPEEAGQMGMMFQQIQMTFGPLFRTLGPEIYMVSNIDKPYSATSRKSVTVIRAKDAQIVNQAMQQFAPMMGLSSRDFLGNTIWSAPAGGGMGIPLPAFGIGGGYLAMGNETTVENALRAIDRAGDGALADEPEFQRATAPLNNEAIAYGWTDMEAAIDYTEWTMNNFRAVIEQQVNAMPGMADLDPQFKQQMIEDQMKAMPEWMKDAPDMNVVKNNMGDGIFELRSTDNGFMGRWLVLRKN